MSVHIPTCRHIKENGVWCGSPALRGHHFCYFHHKWREARPSPKPVALDLPPLEDANAIQVALQRVMQAILDGAIDGRTAGLLLYALQTAACNVKNTFFNHPSLREQARGDYAAGLDDEDEERCHICAGPEDPGEEEDGQEDGQEKAAQENQGQEQAGQDEEQQEEQSREVTLAGSPGRSEAESWDSDATPVPVAERRRDQPAASGDTDAENDEEYQALLAACRPPKAAFGQLPVANRHLRRLPETDAELTDDDLVEAIRQLAGLK